MVAVTVEEKKFSSRVTINLPSFVEIPHPCLIPLYSEKRRGVLRLRQVPRKIPNSVLLGAHGRVRRLGAVDGGTAKPNRDGAGPSADTHPSP